MSRWFATLAAGVLLLLPVSAMAQGPAPADGWVARSAAELQVLDKVTARVSVLRAPLNTPTPFGALSITVRACNARPADEVPDAVAWMEIADSRRPEATRVVFRGWMYANTPAANMLEHPVYDVRVLDCR